MGSSTRALLDIRLLVKAQVVMVCVVISSRSVDLVFLVAVLRPRVSCLAWEPRQTVLGVGATDVPPARRRSVSVALCGRIAGMVRLV